MTMRTTNPQDVLNSIEPPDAGGHEQPRFHGELASAGAAQEGHAGCRRDIADTPLARYGAVGKPAAGSPR